MKAKTQRTKKSPLSIDAGFPIPYEAIKFKLRISPDALKLLYFLSLGEPKAVGETVAHILEPWHNTLVGKAGRGIHSGRQTFMSKMKILIAYLYRWIFDWFEKHDDEEEWPVPLRDMVHEIRNETDEKLTPSDKTSLKALKTTAHILEKFYGHQRAKYHIKEWTDNLDSFRRTYLSRKNNEFMKWFERDQRYFPPIYNGTPIITEKDPPGLINLLKVL